MPSFQAPGAPVHLLVDHVPRLPPTRGGSDLREFIVNDLASALVQLPALLPMDIDISPNDSGLPGISQLRTIVRVVFDLLEATTDDERALLNTQKKKLDDEGHVDYVPTDAVGVTIAQARVIQPPDLGTKTKLPRHQAGQASNFSSFVELRGLEPLTLCLQSRCATSCAIAPCVTR